MYNTIQSTIYRGFNIKKFSTDSSDLTIINVPGFEPLISIIILGIAEGNVYNATQQDIETMQPRYQKN